MSPFHDDARLVLAESLVQNEKFDEAQAQFKDLLADPQSDEFVQQASLSTLIELAARNEDWKAAAEFAKSLIDRFPDSPKRLAAEFRRGEAALRQDDFETARSLLTKLHDTLVEASDPRAAKFEWAEGVWLLLTESELQARNYPRVAALVEEFHMRFPESRVAYQADEILGRSLIRTGEVDRARKVLQKVIDSPDGAKTETAARAQIQIADSYFGEPNYATAVIEYYKVASSYDLPEMQAAALYQAGQCEELRKKATAAVDFYNELVEKFPDSPWSARARERIQALKPLTE
jgi:TolA-binding protein